MNRRSLIAAATAALATPALAQDRFAGLEARAAELDQLHAVVVLEHGRTVYERAFRGPGLNRPVNVKSVSKTLLATLFGIQGLRPEARLSDVLDLSRAADPRATQVRFRDLLSMRSGFIRTSGANYGDWVSSGNWVRYILSRPMAADPGARFSYSTGDWHLVAAALTRTHGNLHDQISRALARPLDIQMPPWTRDPQGIYMGGNNMAISPRGLARFGHMILAGGRWNGVQVVPRDWIDQSWLQTGRSPFSGHGYGFGWFLTRLGREPLRYARGYGGQFLWLLPERGVVVVMTSDPNRPARSTGYAGQLLRLLDQQILV